jgi:hypothetical protein
MAAKKITDSELLASLKRRVIQPVVTVIEDVETVRVDPSATGRRMPPWQRVARRKGNTKHTS